ncbi:hypothetical protein WA026_001835 [Henosepilachna vigintioctopunctata]
MAAAGVRPCVISRQLKVSHGCVSKILNRYQETGSIRPGVVGSSKGKTTTSALESRMEQIKRENPTIVPQELRNRLIKEGLSDAPSVTYISKFLQNDNSRGDDLYGKKDYTIHSILGGKLFFVMSSSILFLTILVGFYWQSH